MYILSKDIVLEELKHRRVYKQYNHEEFLKLIYMIALFVYSPESYSEDERDKHHNMFDESEYIKFKEILKMILEKHMIDPDA